MISVRDGDFNDGALPDASADLALPKIVSLTGPATATNGGTAILHVEVSPPMASPRFVVQLENATGFHSVTGVDPNGDGIHDISVQVSGEADQTTLVLLVALLDSAGNRGPFQPIEVGLVHSGIGDVKVTLSFDRLHDLDLHVIEPSGDEIFYERPGSVSGGQLDLDSGANCQASAANSENVFWPPGGAPAGDYRVRVQNYQQCEPGDIAFTVTVAYDGSVQTFDGHFADGTAAELPGAGNVLDIATFHRGP